MSFHRNRTPHPLTSCPSLLQHPPKRNHRFLYSAFLTIICLLCPATIIWLDPFHLKAAWSPAMMFLVSDVTSLTDV